jgi:hypothetical protein
VRALALLGNAHVPSVTVRLRAKLAPEVARRLESFSACEEGATISMRSPAQHAGGGAHLVRGGAGQQVLRQRGLGLGRGEEDGGQRSQTQRLRVRKSGVSILPRPADCV